MTFVRRVAAIHDISCIGRCSLTVIMPILSAMGIQVCPLPTAVFSTHLGGFGSPAFCDFTSYMTNFFDHWRQEKITFECIYSGFLASEQQIDIVDSFIAAFSENHPLVIVDPVMGDSGKLYSVFSQPMQQRMKELVGKADIITPNYTEACFLLGESYQETVSDLGQMEDWLIRLSAMGPPMTIITGIVINRNKILTMGYDRSNHSFCKVYNDHIPAKYPGTGDVFASVLAGALLRDNCLAAAMKQAADFVALAIQVTLRAGTPPREGVLLEKVLPQLWCP